MNRRERRDYIRRWTAENRKKKIERERDLRRVVEELRKKGEQGH